MNYLNMVRNAPKKSEKIMWESVEAFSELLEKMKSSHPDMARAFLMKEHERMYGPYFDEEMAREVVSCMFHYNAKEEKIQGEAVTPEEAFEMLDGIEHADEKRWDAYVGANGFMHDMARSNLSSRQIMEMAKVFWFEDDDFDGESKVFWYYSNK